VTAGETAQGRLIPLHCPEVGLLEVPVYVGRDPVNENSTPGGPDNSRHVSHPRLSTRDGRVIKAEHDLKAERPKGCAVRVDPCLRFHAAEGARYEFLGVGPDWPTARAFCGGVGFGLCEPIAGSGACEDAVDQSVRARLRV
jgi:hypothetical protein